MPQEFKIPAFQQSKKIETSVKTGKERKNNKCQNRQDCQI